ncbi:tyrosine-type recombinase/integrase [Desulfovibrio sp. SGI.169]|uniref:tyrosine-type recombinase/integrase n=1 Tax=Desulfovibrio sp. SGI.169 TaxID=3420561 RepID=UPI003D08D46D
MAIRYRKGRALPWQCYWNNPLTKKRECANFLTEEDAKKYDSLIKHRIRFERESFKKEEEEPEEKQTVLTLEGAYLLYLKQKQFSKTGLQWQMKCMRYPLLKIGMKPINEVSRKDIETVMLDMLQWNVKPVTVREYLKVLRTVLNWCKTEMFCGHIDFPKLPPAKYEKFIPPTPEEIREILNSASPHIKRVIVIGSQLGVRVGESELLRLTWSDVDLERCVVRVHGAKKNPNAPWREIPIRRSLLPIFRQWQAEDAAQGIIYLVHYKNGPIRRIWHAWHNTLRRAGIIRRIRPYDLRHAFGTELVAAGVDVGTVASLMGHSNPTMLLTHYQYVMDKQKRAAVESLPDVPICAQNACAQSDGYQ